MVSFISLKQKVFCDTRKCIFRCWTNRLWCSTRIYLRVAPLPNIFYQDKDVEKIEKILNKEFSSLCEWFIDNKLSIHFGDYKAKTIFFSRMKISPKLSISYEEYSLKQHNNVKYLGCYLDSNLKRRRVNCSQSS